MSHLHIATRGIGCWRSRLTHSDGQWGSEASAFEAAVSWEWASQQPSGLPEPVERMFRVGDFGDPVLLMAVAGHQVPVLGFGGGSKCDLWALLQTTAGAASLTVEVIARESFGFGTLRERLVGHTPRATADRERRWEFMRTHLPTAGPDAYMDVAYPLLHRCAAAVAEARRFRLKHAAFIVQAFGSPPERFEAFARFCSAINLTIERNALASVRVGEITLGIGWVDCPFATDSQVACTA
ncbi:MAG: hypothetical protein C0467_21710 [Planctomycetaceae bacterium]|nr:hypothetical protein [Planctomycetaceae bacterium]